jgi:Fic family protein
VNIRYPIHATHTPLMNYQPPFTITPAIVRLVAEISEQLGRVIERMSATHHTTDLRLRRIQRIRTIQGSLAIEGNTLNEAQITAILNGKPVIAPLREVQEVKNALAAYERFEQWQSHHETDLLAAHALLMLGLVDDAGCYRNSGVGVMSGTTVIHMAPPASQVPRLMHDLMHWLAHTDQHPLISSTVFHYEFEFIHPFSDGNGRLGRLWQSKILSEFHPLFANIPVESIVYAHQADYYAAIADSTAQTNIAPFIQFMLSMIRHTLIEHTTLHITPLD